MENELSVIVGTRRAVINQVCMTKEELTALYPKLQLPLSLVEQDYQRNQVLLKRCYETDRELGLKIKQTL